MPMKVVAICFTGLLLLCHSSESRADAKAAAVVLKSTVIVEWRAETAAGKPQFSSLTPAPAYVTVAQSGVPGETSPGYVFAEPKGAVAPSGPLPPNAATIAITPPVERLLDPQVRFITATLGADTPPVITGSGVIVGADGLIATSLPTKDGGKVSVTLEDGRTFPASRLVLDQRSGLQLLKIDAQDLQAIELNLDAVEVGEDVVAGMFLDKRSPTLRRGIITGKSLSVHGPCPEVIPTDVPAWDSMHGAPLVGQAGRLVGLLSKSDESQVAGVTFAVPTRFVKLLLESRPTQNSVVIRKGYLGVQLGGGKGNLIVKVNEDSPAAKSGLQENDEITKVDDAAIKIPEDVIRAVSQHQGGEKVQVYYIRDGKELNTEITLSTFPESPRQTVDVNLVKPPQLLLLTLGSDGKLVSPSELNVFPPKAAPATDSGKKSPPLNPSPSVPWAELTKAYQNAHLAQTHVGSTLKVERSDLTQKLDELKGQVDALKTEVSKLTKVLEQLEKKLNP